jgi:hypothetical protein
MSYSITDRVIMAKCREVLSAPCRHDHVDLGHFLVAYLKGEDNLDTFLWRCDVTWLGSKCSPPVLGEHGHAGQDWDYRE